MVKWLLRIPWYNKGFGHFPTNSLSLASFITNSRYDEHIFRGSPVPWHVRVVGGQINDRDQIKKIHIKW